MTMYMGDDGLNEALLFENFLVTTVVATAELLSESGFLNIRPPAAKRQVVVKRMVVFIFQ